MYNYRYFRGHPLWIIFVLGSIPSNTSDPQYSIHWNDDNLDWQNFQSIIERRLGISKSEANSHPNDSQRDLMTYSKLAVGESDYLDFSNLQKGITTGLSVCRILLNTQEPKALTKLIEGIIKFNQAQRQSDHKITANYLRRISNVDKFDNTELNNEHDELNNEQDIENVLKTIKYLPIGTGFLVGRNYLLTNFHIVDAVQETEIENMIAEFGYEYDYLGRQSEPVYYRFKSIVVTSKKHQNDQYIDLDYALVKLNSNSEPLRSKRIIKQRAGELFGFIELNSDHNAISSPINSKILAQYNEDNNHVFKTAKKILAQLENIDTQEFYWKLPGLLGEPAIIIQHPQGEYKQIVLSNNRVIKINKNFLYYETDSDHGSSGSPVFNQNWQLIGINRAPVYVDQGKVVDNLQGSLEAPILIGYEGSRICQITNQLRESLNEEILQELNLTKAEVPHEFYKHNNLPRMTSPEQQYPLI